MNDRPTSGELLDAVRLFLEKELAPTLTDARLRFQTLVAIHVLGVAMREQNREEEQLLREAEALVRLLGETSAMPTTLAELRRQVRTWNENLCEQIREGEFDDPTRRTALMDVLKRQVQDKLHVSNPRYLGGRIA